MLQHRKNINRGLNRGKKHQQMESLKKRRDALYVHTRTQKKSVFWALPHSDLLLVCKDPDLDPDTYFSVNNKKVRKTLIYTIL
jgi:hypothetical protein